MPANLENSAVATGLEKVSFHFNPKERQCQRMLKLPHISHTKSSKRLSEFTFTFHFPALEKEMATHSSILAWRIQGTEEPAGLPSMRLHRVRHNWRDLATAVAHASKVMLKILQARLQQYTNQELLDVQAGFQKGRGTRDQITNIHWIVEKAREFQ